jgi:hypothetical protein
MKEINKIVLILNTELLDVMVYENSQYHLFDGFINNFGRFLNDITRETNSYLKN